jgi:chaperonin GroEL
MRNNMKILAVKAPRYGEERRTVLEDLAIISGATFISKDSGIRLRNVKLEHLGEAKTVEVSKYNTTLVGGNTDYAAMDEKIETIRGSE